MQGNAVKWAAIWHLLAPQCSGLRSRNLFALFHRKTWKDFSYFVDNQRTLQARMEASYL
jgi:hypothetical protein